MQKKFNSWLVLVWATLCLQPCAQADNASLGTEAIINLPLVDAWQLFTGETGLKSLGYAQASVDMRLGGVIQASGGDAVLGNFREQIISFEPQHMLSFKASGAPVADQWTVLYFVAMGEQMTQLRWLEFFPGPQSSVVTAHQQRVRKLFDQLIRRYAPECEVCKLERERSALPAKSINAR
jgi:hypothetical protein